MMKLPHGNKAYIPFAKLSNYLLSTVHSVGKSKAKFFRIFGFNENNIDLREKGLLPIAEKEEVKRTEITPYGTKYVIEGSMNTPKQTIIKGKYSANPC